MEGAEPFSPSGLLFDDHVISFTEPGAIGEQTGLQPGDKILSINGRPADEDSLNIIDERLTAGRSVMIEYERDGQRKIATLRW